MLIFDVKSLRKEALSGRSILAERGANCKKRASGLRKNVEPVTIVCYTKVVNKFRSEAVKLREAGYSYGMINEKLGVSKATLSDWFKDKPFKPNKEVLRRIQYGPIINGERRHNKKVEEVLHLRSLGRSEIGQMSKRDFFLLGLGLYIGEGSKAYEQIQIANSNPAVIKIMILWFKEVFNLGLENIAVTIHLYPDNDLEAVLSFWQNLTGISRKNFRKTYVDVRKNKSKFRKNKLPYGTAYIRIKSNGDPEKGVRLHRKLQGWMQAVLPPIE